MSHTQDQELLPVVDGDSGDVDIYGHARTEAEARTIADRECADPVARVELATNVVADGTKFPRVWLVVTRPNLVSRLAREFSRRLLITMRETNLGLVRLRNARQKNPSICHTHDFCDANEVMAEAFKAITGRDFDLENQEDSALWHDAWDEAKAREFRLEDGDATGVSS